MSKCLNNDLADLYDLMNNQANPEIIKIKVQTIILEQFKKEVVI